MTAPRPGSPGHQTETQIQQQIPGTDTPEAATGKMKKCTRCSHIRPISEYYKEGNGHRARCRRCEKEIRNENRDEHRKRCADWYRENQEEYRAKRRSEYQLRKDEFAAKRLEIPVEQRRRSARAVHLKRKYGLSLEMFDAMVIEQGGVCAICMRVPNKRGFCVDHDHGTGRVRQLLCQNCNSLIGMAEDNKDLLWSAIRYIAMHAKRSS